MSNTLYSLKSKIRAFIKLFFPERSYLEDFQIDILKRIEKFVNSNEKSLLISIVAAKGVGKTDMLSFVAIWALFCYDSAAIELYTSRQDQTKATLINGVKLLLEHSLLKDLVELEAFSIYKKDLAGKPIKTSGIMGKVKNEKNPDAMAGTHRPFNVVILDEAASLPLFMLEVIAGVLATGRSIIFVSGNATNKNSLLYHTYYNTSDEDWIKYNVTYNDVKRPGYNKDNLEKVYKPGTREYIQMCLAQFTDDDDGKFFTLCDANILTSKEHTTLFGEIKPRHAVIGVDPATGIGGDSTVFVLRYNNMAYLLSVSNTMKREEIVRKISEYYYAGYRIILDCSGIGQMLISDLKAENVRPIRFFGHQPPTRNHNMFVNIKSQMYNEMKEAIVDSDLVLEHNNVYSTNILKQEIFSIPYTYEEGKINIAKKQAMKKSPDILDALSYTFYYGYRTDNNQ